jgi:hypothetical protein
MMNENEDDLDVAVHRAAGAIEREIKDLRRTAPAPTGETIAWIGSRGRGRWVRLSWNEGSGPLGNSTGLTIGIWAEDTFGVKTPVRYGAFTFRIQEIQQHATAVLIALVRGRTAAAKRHFEQAEYNAERRAQAVNGE